jgi:Flp pilus assembly protein TadG
MERADGDCDRGSSSVETALATALMLFLLMAVVEFAMMEHDLGVTKAAATMALNEAQAEGGSALVGQRAGEAALSELGGTAVLNPVVSVNRNGENMTAIVRGTVNGPVPWLDLPVTSRATGPIERFTYPTAAGR